MTDLKIYNENNKTEQCFKLPEGWHEVKLHQFTEIQMLNSKIKDTDELGLIEKSVNVISCLIDSDDITIRQLDMSQFNILVQQCAWAISTEPKKNIPEVIIINDKEYMFDPDLNNMSFGMWIDLNMFLKKSASNIWSNMHQIIACLIRPVKNKIPKYPNWYIDWKNRINRMSKINEEFKQEYKYEIEEYETESRNQRAELFDKELNLDIAYPVSLFFYHFAAEFLDRLKDYSQEEIPTPQVKNTKKIKQWFKNTMKNGVGS